MKYLLLTLALLMGGCAVNQPAVQAAGDLPEGDTGINQVVVIAHSCKGTVVLKAAVVDDRTRASVTCLWEADASGWPE